MQKLEEAQGKLQSTNEEFELLRKQNKQAKFAFEKVKTERYNKFNTCFDHVSNEIDNIYKVSSQLSCQLRDNMSHSSQEDSGLK